MPPSGQTTTTNGATTQRGVSSTSRFLPSATAGPVDNSDFKYVARPPNVPAGVAPNILPPFPPPSVCEEPIGTTPGSRGLACYTPALIRSAYHVPSNLNGTGQTIVIVDAFGSPTVRSDLHTFDQTFGLPDPPLNIYYPTGKPPPLGPSKIHDTLSWADETSLDVQWSHAIAPGAAIALVIASSNSGNVLNVAQRYAVQHHLGNIMSLSFGIPEARFVAAATTSSCSKPTQFIRQRKTRA